MFLNRISAVVVLLGLASAGARADGIYLGLNDPSRIVISNVPASDDFTLLLTDPQDSFPVAGVNPSLAVQSSVEPALQPSLLERSRRFAPWVEEAALVSQVDARLLHAVIAVESGYNPRALSPKGAVGIMQLLPATALRYGVVDSWDARQNILGGARYLSSLLRLFHNDTRLALAAYNAGENAVARYNGRIPPYRETEAYVPRVLAVYRHLSKASFR